MLLRQVIAHVRKQEWTAVGIDFLIVVLGVFIGVQAANWNAENAERRALGRYLDAVASDIRSDVDELARVKAFTMNRLSASSILLSEAGMADLEEFLAFSTLLDPAVEDVFTGSGVFAIPNADAMQEDQTNRLWALIAVSYFYDTNRSAFDALISSGNIDLIDDPELMQLLREYYYLVNVLEQTQIRTIIPMRNSLIEKGFSYGFSTEADVEAEALIELVRTDPALRASIGAAREYSALHLFLVGLLTNKAAVVLEALEKDGGT